MRSWFRFGPSVPPVLALLALTALPGGARTQDVEARAFLSAPQVGVGRQFVLNVEVNRSSDPGTPDAWRASLAI